MALPTGYVAVFIDTFTEGSDTALASHTPDQDDHSSGWTELNSLTVNAAGDYVAGGNSSNNQGVLAGIDLTGDFLLIAEMDSNGGSGGDSVYPSIDARLPAGTGAVGFVQASGGSEWVIFYEGPTDSYTEGTADAFPSGIPSGYQELALERVGDTFKSYLNGTLMQTEDLSGTTDFSSSPTLEPQITLGTFTSGVIPRCTRLEVRLPDTGVVDAALATVEITTYAATITGTASGTNVAVALATVEITTYQATITGTSFANDISVGVASVAITTHAATITGTTGIDYALKIGALTVDVRVGGHQAISAPMAHEVRRNAQGKAISSITSSRGYKGRWPITTVPMSSTAADTLETAITTGLPLTVTGWLVGGTVTAKVVGDVTIEPDTGLNYTVSFELQEA